MLGVHDLVPHFAVSTIEGRAIAYQSLWQRKCLALVSVPRQPPAAGDYAFTLAAAFRDDDLRDAECIVTCDAIAGLPCPGALVADRWGEIFFVATATSIDDLPGSDELIAWVRFVQMHCPECEGEAR
jgi:hypothetical protein